MEVIRAALLGIMQGITEFLPISSSAHLILLRWFSGWDPEWIIFDVQLHLGTTIATLAIFWSDWVRLSREVIAGFRDGRPFGNSDRKLAWILVIGTLPAAVAGLALEEKGEEILRSPLIIVFSLVIFGALLFYAERKSKQSRTITDFSWGDSICIGLSQAIALIPGVSRSGITITAAMLRNSNRTSAARFSFLLSTPTIFGAGVLASWRLIEAVRYSGKSAISVQWEAMAVGILCAAVTGFLCIRFFLRYLQTKSFAPFVIYRFLLAGIVLVYYLRFH